MIVATASEDASEDSIRVQSLHVVDDAHKATTLPKASIWKQSRPLFLAVSGLSVRLRRRLRFFREIDTAEELEDGIRGDRMRPGAQIERLEVRPSMVSFDPVPHPRTRPPRNDDRRQLNSELQTKVEELEKFYAVHKIMLSEGGGDLMRRGAGDSETSVKLRGAEFRRGRVYGRYAQKRDVKKSEAWKSNRREMEMMENKFKESCAQMKARRGRDDAAVKYRRQVGTNSTQMTEEEHPEEQMQMLRRQEKSSNHALPSDLSVKSSADRRLLSDGKRSPSTKLQSSASTASIPKPSLTYTNSDSTSGSARAVRSAAQSVPNFSYLRKENMKPPTRGNAPLQSTGRSKSSANLSELKDLSSRNSNHNSDFPPPKLPKLQGQKTINGKIENKANMAPRKANGGSQAELRASKAFEIQDKQVKLENTIEQLMYSADLIKIESIEARPAIFHIEPDSEEPSSSQETRTCDTNKSEKFKILKCANEEDNGLATVSKLSTSSNNENKSGKESIQLSSSNIIQTCQSCVNVASSHTESSVSSPTASPATRTSLHQNMMQEEYNTRVRRRWEISEKPKIASNNSDKFLKEVTQQFKKLLKFGRKGKNAGNSLHNSASSASASGGDRYTEDGHEVSKSLDNMNKSTSEYFSPCYVGLNEGNFRNRQVQSPSYSFSTSPANMKFRKDHQPEGFSKATCSVFSLLPVIPWKGK